MSKKRSSMTKNLGWGFLADTLLFVTAILLMSVFAFTSFSSAYLVALSLLVVAVIAFAVYRKRRRSLAKDSSGK